MNEEEEKEVAEIVTSNPSVEPVVNEETSSADQTILQDGQESNEGVKTDQSGPEWTLASEPVLPPKLEVTHDTSQDPQPLNNTSKAPSLSSLSLTDHPGESATHEANAHVAYEQEIDRLRDLISQKEIENSNLETKLNDYQQQSKQQIEQLHANFTARLEQTLKKFQDLQKDKTSSMVMKYAEAEKRCIDLNRNIELLQSKLGDSNKEKQRMNERLDSAKAETQKLNAEY